MSLIFLLPNTILSLANIQELNFLIYTSSTNGIFNPILKPMKNLFNNIQE